jgi:energy-coupling factor transporter transmembrane protein EcfT
MGQLTAIGFAPGHSLLHRLDPRTKQLLIIGLSAAVLWGGPIFLATLTALLGILFAMAGLRLGRLLAEIRYFLIFLLLVFGVRTLTFDGGWTPTISPGSVTTALLVCWRLLLVVLMGLLLMATTRTAHIRAGLVWFLRPLPVVNAKMAATMVGLVVRFIPVILFQAAEIADAHQARCVQNRKNPLRRLTRFTTALFRRVFGSADELAAAMQARCYHEDRTLPDLSFSRRDGLAGLAGLLVAVSALFPAFFC